MAYRPGANVQLDDFTIHDGVQLVSRDPGTHGQILGFDVEFYFTATLDADAGSEETRFGEASSDFEVRSVGGISAAGSLEHVRNYEESTITTEGSFNQPNRMRVVIPEAGFVVMQQVTSEFAAGGTPITFDINLSSAVIAGGEAGQSFLATANLITCADQHRPKRDERARGPSIVLRCSSNSRNRMARSTTPSSPPWAPWKKASPASAKP